MSLRDALLTEFDLERPFTRRTLERVPEGQNDWKPHEKSMPMGWLATLIALTPSWVPRFVRVGEFIESGVPGPESGVMAFASPKSRTLTVPSGLSFTFCGLRSR